MQKQRCQNWLHWCLVPPSICEGKAFGKNVCSCSVASPKHHTTNTEQQQQWKRLGNSECVIAGAWAFERTASGHQAVVCMDLHKMPSPHNKLAKCGLCLSIWRFPRMTWIACERVWT
mmetsp:Transcript_150276/g.364997  ORF Transcript_150276/g.364997 Transcript_150276/m.364997 type:complete len:117 (+) Transcript_150276:661-1011(+)